MNNWNSNKSRSIRVIALGGLSLGIFFGGYAASAATTPLGDITLCANSKSGAIRQVAKCSSAEKTITIQAGGNGEIMLTTKHIFPATSSARDSWRASAAVCPTSAPLFLGVKAFIAKPSIYSLGEINDAGRQSIFKVGTGPGEIRYSAQESSATLLIYGPLTEKLEIYTITSCANPKNVTTINY